MIMKKFIVTFKNLDNGKTLDNLYEADEMLNAMYDAESLCKKLKKHDISLKVISIYEIK